MTLIRSGTTSGDVPLRINTPGKERAMPEEKPAELKVYTVQMGRDRTTTMQLTEAGVKECEELGYKVEPLASAEPEQKSVQAAPQDKARAARNK